MSGEKGKKIGQLSEKACMLEMEKMLKEEMGLEIGQLIYNRDEYKELLLNLKIYMDDPCLEELEKRVLREDKVAEWYKFAITGARELGRKIINDIFKYVESCGSHSDDFIYSLFDTSKVGNREQQTDDICVILTHKKTKEEIKFPLSLKTKSSTGNRIDGNLSTNNSLFVNKIFANTPLLDKYPEILEIADDKLYRDEYNKTYRKIKKQGGTSDGASDLVNEKFNYQGGKHGNKSNNLCWKRICAEKLQEAIMFAFAQEEYKTYQSQIQKNILSNAGYKIDTHLALALRKENESSVHLYTSINCKNYAKIISGSFKKIKMDIRKGSNYFHFMFDDMKISLDYRPSGMILKTNPFKTLLR